MLSTRTCIASRRSGISRIDVVVLLAIAALLAAFLLPAQRTARSSARKLQCLNEMRNVGLSVHNFASANDGHLPNLADEMEIKSGSMTVGWPITLLPALDSGTLLRNIKQNAIVDSRQSSGTVFRMSPTEQVVLQTFTCPDDTDSFKKPGGLSFVVNAGLIPRSLYHGDPDGLHRLGHLSWDGNDVTDEPADVAVAAAGGVFWRKSKAFQPSLDYVENGDGVSQTIMVSENLQAGNWWDTDTARIAFGIPVDTVNGRVPFGRGTIFESTERPLNARFDGGTLATASPQDWRINCDLKAATGTRPRPSSNHAGGVNVIFVDGAGRFLNENIDPGVYLRLITPNAVMYGEVQLNASAY